ncbi:hypothetical protein FHG87_020030 [Trinorchestia longiramus]|nr:hypothetical protein FHG87_020030 [Trinorchestia longiramus]
MASSILIGQIKIDLKVLASCDVPRKHSFISVEHWKASVRGLQDNIISRGQILVGLAKAKHLNEHLNSGNAGSDIRGVGGEDGGGVRYLFNVTGEGFPVCFVKVGEGFARGLWRRLVSRSCYLLENQEENYDFQSDMQGKIAGDASDGQRVNQPCQQDSGVKLVHYASGISNYSSNQFSFFDTLAYSAKPCSEILPRASIWRLFHENGTSDAANLTSTDIMAAKSAVPFHLPLSSIGGLGITEENSQPADPIPVKIPSRNFKKAVRASGKAYFTVAGKFIDTCQTCDTLNLKIKAAENENHRLLLEGQRTAHHVRAEETRSALTLATNYSKTREDVLVFTFDLQKTQPLPHLTTSVAFYKRQLWLYNLGINTRHDNKGHMCTWLESEDRRGANELCSCLLEFLKTKNWSAIEHVKTFSDCCGGQNRNRTMISFMMWACRNFDLKSWEHRFMEPGHSYLPNDSDFGKIEKRKKKYGPIYSKDTYTALIK